MNRIRIAVLAALFALAAPSTLSQARADEIPPNVQKAVDKGLEWLVKTQHSDGHWAGQGGQYAPGMTPLAGMAFLMEGSTIREGKYKEQIRKATEWCMDKCQRNGMIGLPNDPNEGGRYMYGHGFSLLFLASVYGEEENAERRKKLEDILTRAVQFTAKAQTSAGGFGYVSSRDGQDFAEGSVTITQIQAVRAARNAGIVCPKETIDKARVYLEKCTRPDGEVGYYIGQPAITPALTAAGICCMFNAGEYDNKLVKQWFGYCQRRIPLMGAKAGRQGHDEYTHYYYAQTLYILGDDGYAKLFPNSKVEDRLTWKKYRDAAYDNLVKTQAADGSWTGMSEWSHVGPVYVTALFLGILQLDKGTLPIYQR